MLNRRCFLAIGLLLAASVGPLAAAADKPGAEARAQRRQAAAAAMLADIGRATWVRDGKSSHVAYIFFDPNCPYCHKLYESLRPWVERGDIEARWIPVGTLMLTSAGKAAAILEADDRAAALRENEQKFSRETGTFGGVMEELAPKKKTLDELAANYELLKHSGDGGVPLMLVRLKDGSARAIVGAPPQTFLEKLMQDIE
jgi:thiol:disulfide interchange protein DsbG